MFDTMTTRNLIQRNLFLFGHHFAKLCTTFRSVELCKAFAHERGLQSASSYIAQACRGLHTGHKWKHGSIISLPVWIQLYRSTHDSVVLAIRNTMTSNDAGLRADCQVSQARCVCICMQECKGPCKLLMQPSRGLAMARDCARLQRFFSPCLSQCARC